MDIGLPLAAAYGAALGYGGGSLLDARVKGVCCGAAAAVAAVGLGILFGPVAFYTVAGLTVFSFVVRLITQCMERDKAEKAAAQVLQKRLEKEIRQLGVEGQFYQPTPEQRLAKSRSIVEKRGGVPQPDHTLVDVCNDNA